MKKPVKLRSQRLYNHPKAVEEQKTSLPSTTSGVVRMAQLEINVLYGYIFQETALESANVSLQSIDRLHLKPNHYILGGKTIGSKHFSCYFPENEVYLLILVTLNLLIRK